MTAAVAVSSIAALPSGGANDAVIGAFACAVACSRPLALTVTACEPLLHVMRSSHASTVSPIEVTSVTTPSSNSASSVKRGWRSLSWWIVMGFGESQMRSTLSWRWTRVHTSAVVVSAPLRAVAVAFTRKFWMRMPAGSGWSAVTTPVSGSNVTPRAWWVPWSLPRKPAEKRSWIGGVPPAADAVVATRGIARHDRDRVAVVVDLDVVDPHVVEQVGGGVAGEEVGVHLVFGRQRESSEAVPDDRHALPFTPSTPRPADI